jgi:hypothetical protein
MTNRWSKQPEAMMKSVVSAMLVFREEIKTVLAAAGIPEVEMIEGDDGMPVAVKSGYYTMETDKPTSKVVSILPMGRDGIDDVARRAERDGLTQQLRAALSAAGMDVRVNEYGNVTVVYHYPEIDWEE